MQRDHEVNEELKNLGYTVFRFWETDIKKNLEECLTITLDHLKATQ
ncbi:MAG: very short patch repair endonuclease [Maribacter sp.]|nr:very short patch repair endonuclease [Maribacter sp.]